MKLRPIVSVAIGLLIPVLAVLYYIERKDRQLSDLRLVTSERKVALLEGRLEQMADATASAASRMTRPDHLSTPSISSTPDARKEAVEATVPRTDEKPKSDLVPLADRGSSSPSATITSMQWAMSSYDPAALAGLIYIADYDRRELESVMSRLSADQQAVYKSPEQLLSTLLCDPRNMKELSSIRVLSEDRVDRDHSVVRIEASDRAGNRLQGAYYLHKTADGWRWVISSASVKEAAESLRRDVPKR